MHVARILYTRACVLHACIHVQGTLDTENPIIITGTVGKGRFGSAIVNVGDINDDGFEGWKYFIHTL